MTGEMRSCSAGGPPGFTDDVQSLRRCLIVGKRQRGPDEVELQQSLFPLRFVDGEGLCIWAFSVRAKGLIVTKQP